MLKYNPDLIIIDLDGTLVDSVPDLAYCADKMLLQLGLPERGEEAVREWIGNGVDKLVKRALTNSLEEEPEAQLFARALSIFNELYGENASKRSVLYPGVETALAWFQENAYALVCVTNKAERFTLPLLQAKGIAEYFSIVISGDTLAKKKPDPLPLLYAAEKLEVSVETSLMIGDSQHDVAAARAAGMQMACVSYGYNHGEDIALSNPDVVVDSMDEIVRLLPRSLKDNTG